MKRVSALTKREQQIARFIVDGLSNKEVARRLHISHRTVDTHRTNIMRKLKVHNAASLVRYLMINKIL